jgi:hypothetical protein
MKKTLFSFAMSRSAKTGVLICIVLQMCSSAAFGASTKSTEAESSLTGRFVARIDGPPLTSFGSNRQSYIFQINSYPEPQFVILRYTFFLYEPQIPRWALDYIHVYNFHAVKNDHCTQTLEEISKRYVLDKKGKIIGTQYGINYLKNAPPLAPLSKTPMPCYALSSQSVSSIQ